MEIFKEESWHGQAQNFKRNISRDFGQSFDLEEDTQIFGTYFFLSANMVHHTRVSFNIVQFMASFGGFYQLTYTTMNLIGRHFNH